MSALLQPLSFPLHGSRLIEASAGTGKTWTIAALYLRLVLGHGGENGFVRPLLPPEILVMTFTRAATRELSNRVRERLVQAAAYFRGESEADYPFLYGLAQDCADDEARQMASYRLMLAAEAMDEAAIFTIDAWCQRMLREHAFDSGSLFDEELVSDESALLEDATHDYWRQHVYPLNEPELRVLLACFKDVRGLGKDVRYLVQRAGALGADDGEPLAALIARLERRRLDELAHVKAGWPAHIEEIAGWIEGHWEADPKCFHGGWMKPETVRGWIDALRRWAADPAQQEPEIDATAWNRLTPEGIRKACKKGFEPEMPESLALTTGLRAALAAFEPVRHALLRHAAGHVARRIEELKRRNRQFGFADMLTRLKAALEGANGEALRRRIVDQFPVALVDEFQDTSPAQYRIFDLLYRTADNDPQRGLFLIGDPKQSIYGFRGADIHSYLAARRATAGRHYQLGTNYRSTRQLVAAVNRMFLHAEGHGAHPGYAAGAFRFRKDGDNPLPFEAVDAAGRKEELAGVEGPLQALAVNLSAGTHASKANHLAWFAHHCAEHIVRLLNDERVGFRGAGGAFRRLVPADIAVLVRDRNEAGAIRRALMRREVASVYLSDKDSVLASAEAADVLRWLKAVANPLDGALARIAFATATAALPLAVLTRLANDEQAWEVRVEQIKALHQTWQRQGVLAMLRRFIHELDLPAKLLRATGGERSLTNLLHLAELLQEASRELDGEQALIRWFAEQMEDEDKQDDERVLRLESDADLVKVVTVHKSKGLEYPLVYLPFAASARKTSTRGSFFEYVHEDGERRIDLSLSEEARQAVDRERLDEDLRLLYVALTRARHFLWLGVAAQAGRSKLHESALGYLLGGGEEIAPEALHERWLALRGDLDGIELHTLDEPEGCTMLRRADVRPELVEPPAFEARFERYWAVGSFTSLTRHTMAPPTRPQEENLMEEAEPGTVEVARSEDAPWHRFPRGATPGNFLHERLEWMAQEGFHKIDDENFLAQLTQRIERAGYANRLDDALAWLRMIATTRLPPIGSSLAGISEAGTVLPEMEFWFPSRHLDVGALDRLCRQRLLGPVARPVLPERQLHGMLKGFTDLVFEHEGRYWVLDYKSNALGPGDAAYTNAAMAAGMAGHRYDIQGAIYMLAVHRLLRARLGDDYRPERQLGGAVFLFLRGIANPATHGCYLLEPDLALLDGLDRLLGDGTTP
jgi:exodeoxyribonuclease V beta subunit